MEDDVGLVALEDALHLRAVLDVADHRHDGREAAVVDELTLDLKEGRLGVVDDDDALAADARDLAAQLGADRAAGARDQHGLVAAVGGDLLEIDLDLLAAEHVLDLNGADLPGQVDVAHDQLGEAGQRAHRDPLALGHRHDARAQSTRRRRDGDQQLVRLVVVQDARQLVGRAEHADALQAHVALLRVVVDQADRRVARLALQLADHQLRRVPGAHDEHLSATLHQAERVRPLDERARQHPRPADHGQRDQKVEDRDRARQPQLADRLREVDDHVGEHAGRQHADRGAPHIARGEVAPPAVREAEQHEHRHLDRHDDPDRPVEEGLVEDRQAVVEAQLEGQRPRDRDETRIDPELPDAVVRQRDANAAHAG